MPDRSAAVATPAARRTAARVALVTLAAACGAPAAPAEDSLVYGPVVRRQLPAGLVQRVEFARHELREGDTLRVRSVVVNESGTARAVTYLTCRLDVAAEVPLTDPFARCGGYSATATLQPGDSVVQSDARLVARVVGDGTPVVRVRHLLDPDYVLEARIRVRE